MMSACRTDARVVFYPEESRDGDGFFFSSERER